MAFLQSEKLFSHKWFVTYSLIILGAFILAAGFVFFITPYRIVPGGVYGIAIVVHHLTKGMVSSFPDGLPVGAVGLVLNIPLTIIGIRILGPRFGVKTIVGFILTSAFIDVITWFWGEKPLVTDDALLSSIFGGVLIGLGLGLIFKSKATSGGSDIIAMILAKYTRLPLGQLMIYVDSVIVLVGLAAFGDWRIPLYSWIVIFITGKVIDVVIEGIGYDKTLFIISEKHQEIRSKIIEDLNRGGTLIQAKGMFNYADKTIIFTVVNRRELAILEDYIHSIDPKAFLTVINANEILGQGFKSLEEKVTE
ncbi:MAG: YitT family protein [Bacteroidales bacterium]|nr:YitT family protein [Lentimicrobiaceae bacterium]MDD5694955.1 YitT family protein [Bacteroidales bacterium]